MHSNAKKPQRMKLATAAAAFMLATSLGCGRDDGQDPAVARGRSVYLDQCGVCHNSDPSVDGAVGPAVAGASRELLEARILRGEYPPGYTPKRTSRAMAPLPHLEPNLDDLTAYLQSVAP